VNEIYRTLCEITGMQPPVTHAPKRPGDARDAQFEYALAERELGWRPETALLDGMRQTYEYFKNLLPVS
jgi:nucleoside-diphosphate-sugar epimerase